MKRFVSLLLAFGLSLTLMTAFTSAFASGDPVYFIPKKIPKKAGMNTNEKLKKPLA